MSIIQTESVFSPTDINTTINHEPRMQDLRLAEALGFSQCRDIRKSILRHQDALEHFGELICATVAQNKKRGRPGKEYWLTKKQCLYLCAKSETPNATEITIQMVEIFDQVTNGEVVKVRSHLRRKPTKSTIPFWEGQLREAHDRLAALGCGKYSEQSRSEARLLAMDMADVKRQFDTLFYRISAIGGLPAPAHIARKHARPNKLRRGAPAPSLSGAKCGELSL